MRKITFGVACSLDHFIARADHGVDWLVWSDDVSAIMSDYWKTVDTILIGRKSYEVTQRMSGDYGGADNAFPGVTTYVFSRTLPPRSEKGTEIVSGDAVPFVRGLKERDGRDICMMGGGELARSLFEADLIDEVGLNIHPVLLGSGIPLFLPMNRQIDLELIESRPLKGGCVLVSYRVKR
jgi:dihydrofolate reductase